MQCHPTDVLFLNYLFTGLQFLQSVHSTLSVNSSFPHYKTSPHSICGLESMWLFKDVLCKRATISPEIMTF